MTEVGSWRDRAACRDLVTADDDPFSVRDDCLTFAVRTGQQYGVWGGQTEQTVRRLIALDRAGRPSHGRVSAGHPNASKTRCKRGHPFDAHNTYYAPDGQRRCRTCLREAQPVRALEGGGSDAA